MLIPTVARTPHLAVVWVICSVVSHKIMTEETFVHNGTLSTLKANSHIPCRSHAAPMPLRV
jgi:hypothetical protein